MHAESLVVVPSLGAHRGRLQAIWHTGLGMGPQARGLLSWVKDANLNPWSHNPAVTLPRVTTAMIMSSED